MGDLRRALADVPASPTWVAGQLRLLETLNFYNPARGDEAAQKAMLVAWVQALQGVPAPFVVEAFAFWRRTGTRWPVPGDIANRAQDNIREVRSRFRLEDPCREPAPFAPPADLTEAERARRAAIFKAWQSAQ